MEIFIEKERVIINHQFTDIEFQPGNDNSTIRAVELKAHDKSYFFIPALFIGNKDVMAAVIYGKHAVNIFQVKQDVIIHADYNISGCELKRNENGTPLYFVRRSL